MARLHRPAEDRCREPSRPPSEEKSGHVSHPSLRSTLVPLASGLAAVIAVCGLCGATPALGATGASWAGAVEAGRAAATGGAASVRAQEWWLTGLHVTQAWPTTQGSGVTVAVLSTGVAASHPDLTGSVITGPDYTGSGRKPGGAFWGVDGTEVAGLIAGHGHGSGDASGIIGVAPAAKVLSVRVNLEFNDPLNSDAAVARRLPAAIASGITYAVDHGARVIDLPLDPGTFGLTGDGDPAAAGGSAAERSAVAAAARKGVILVAPAGDDGQGPGIVNYPAGYPGVIAVGAVGRNGRLAAFSSRRSYVTLTAPGVNLVTATPPDGYQTISSTSTASGIVAGVAALIVSRFPQLSAAQVTQALTKSTVATAAATPPTAGGVVAGSASAPGTGYGTVNAARAVELAAVISSAGQVRQTATPTATPTPTAAPPKPLRAAAAPHRANASSLAGELVRDAVAVLGVLIVLLIVLLLIMNSRRRRAVTAAQARTGQTPGVHAHRRPDRAASSGPRAGRAAARRAANAARATAAANPGAGALPGTGALPGAVGRPAPSQPTAPATSAWPAPGGWQGGSIIGEIAHSSPPSSRPAMTSAPKPTPSRSSRGAAGRRGSANPASPPWAPAAEPVRNAGPLPMAAANWFSPEPGPGIRVPGDMTAPAAPATEPAPSAFDAPALPSFDRTAAPPASGFPSAPSAPFDPPASPDFPDSPPESDFPAGRPPASDFPVRPAADFRGPPPGYGFTPGPAGFDVTAPQRALGFTTPAEREMPGPATGPEFLTQRNMGFAAAPVATDYPAPPKPGVAPASSAPSAPSVSSAPAAPPVPRPLSGPSAPASPYPGAAEPPGGGSGAGPAGDPGSVWDLAATDVFPVAPPEPGNDDAPDASES
jgi:subtilisin family serine protease